MRFVALRSLEPRRNIRKRIGVNVTDTTPLNKVISEYRNQLSVYIEYADELRAYLKKLLKEGSVEVVDVEARAEDVESLARKLGRKRRKYRTPGSDITDLVGLRTVTYFLEDIDSVNAIMTAPSNFIVDYEKSEDKVTALGMFQFGYRSVHWVVRLPDHVMEKKQWTRFPNIWFEVQVRTITQDAWATVEHRLNYKSDFAMPVELRRDIYALAAVAEMVDKQFSSIRQKREQIKADRERLLGEQPDTTLDKDTLDHCIRPVSKRISGCSTRHLRPGYVTVPSPFFLRGPSRGQVLIG